jgi:hypothetical protein
MAHVPSNSVPSPWDGAVGCGEGGGGSIRLSAGWPLGGEFETGCLTDAGDVGREDLLQAPA